MVLVYLISNFFINKNSFVKKVPTTASSALVHLFFEEQEVQIIQEYLKTIGYFLLSCYLMLPITLKKSYKVLLVGFLQATIK
jgi:hypothetical protein